MVARLVSNFAVLQEYVIAACFQKMLRRMRSDLSLPYISAIDLSSDFKFKETDLKPEGKERKMEQTFGDVLVSLTEIGLLDTPIPNLLSIVRDSEDFDELYTKDTCQEFHMLLRELLQKFLRYLNNLGSLDRPVQSNFESVLRFVAVYGEALQMIAGGVAIQRHLQVIEDEITISHHKRAREVANQAATRTPTPDLETDPDLEIDIELESVQPFAFRDGRALPMWKAAKEWLKLMVVHFDAVKIVNAYYQEAKLTGLTIKILMPPQYDDNMLKWKELLESPEYLSLMTDDFNPLNSITSNSIINSE